MATVSQSGVYNLQSLTSVGALGVGMRLYTYTAGTTTHKTAYTDSAGAVAHTYTSDGSGGQYIAMDARGELPAPLYLTAGGYDLALKTQAGATIWTRRANGLGADLALPGGSSGVGFVADFVGAVTRTLEDRGRETLSVQDAGVIPGEDAAEANCAAYAVLAAAVTVLGGNVNIIWPPGEYHFSPKDSAYASGVDYAWRGACELVDVQNVYHHAAGVTIHVHAYAGWYRGNSTPKLGLDESPIQFRATTSGACDRVGIIGPCTIAIDETLADTTTGHPDGGAFGVAYRGCTNTVTMHVRCEWWGTDGFYFGTGYSNTPEGYNHHLADISTYRCYRQGMSVVGNSHGVILGARFEATQGGSFGHGINFEPNGSMTQRDWNVFWCYTKDNQRGACNFINTSDVNFVSPEFDEQHASASGVVYCEGSNVPGYDAANIRFIAGTIKGLQAILYIVGASTPGGGIDNIEFIDCDSGSLGNALNSNACIRVNPSSLTGRKIGRITFRGGTITGNGGVAMRGDGTTQAELTIQNVRWYTTNPNGSAVLFPWACDGTVNVRLRNVDHSIDTSKTMSTTTPVIARGEVDGCSFTGHASAIVEWRDWTVGWTTRYGHNTWSTYSYYDGCVSALDIKTEGAVSEIRSGDFGAKTRVVHGGRQRVSSYVANSAPFTGMQAPVDGDMTYDVGNAASAVCVTAYAYDGGLTAWRQCGQIIKKGATGSRPSPGTNLTAADTGVMYLDTTLDADGKPIWWNGSAWIDATGATV